jgi:hypothetical protein
MYQQELLYSYNSFAITAVLFVLIILFNEFGFRLGRYVQNRTDDEVKELTGSVQASILGLLALLLGFTFSMSMQRYDDRNQALIEEANAIGTTVLRVQLLPTPRQEQMTQLLSQYIELRITLGEINLTQHAERKHYNQQVKRLQGQLWDLAVQATNEDPRPVTTGAFVAALNDMIDNQGKRHALLQMHVPEVVLLLLFIVFIASVGILGYSSGLSGKRIVAPTVLVSFLISMIVFIIIDLDRPMRGLIQVDQGIMQELHDAGR